jgi:predicted dienelactone hydrolase
MSRSKKNLVAHWHVTPALIVCALFFTCSPAGADESPLIPSAPGIDAPELATLGPHAVGFRSEKFVHHAQPDVEATVSAFADVPLRDRKLVVDLWYPAIHSPGAKRMVYRASLPGEPPGLPVTFMQPGLAVFGATPIGKRHPLVIVSHGYSNSPAVMSWLTENLASKGYVVAAIHHNDPNPYVSSSQVRAAPNFHRPRDIAFVAGQLRASLGDQIDPQNIALIGYSQGGYGVLTAGGATLDLAHPNMSLVAGGLLKKYARGGAGAREIDMPNIKAIIALAPAGGGDQNAWGSVGLAALKAPLLLIAGENDPVVGYEKSAKAFFTQAVSSDRYLLTFKQAGHAIALNPVPSKMRRSLWDIDWFEDPIWRQDRINAINLHFITAFLAVHLRGDMNKRTFLDVPVENSDDGDWNAAEGTPWGAFSPGGGAITLWKGFQRRHARGMILQHRQAQN